MNATNTNNLEIPYSDVPTFPETGEIHLPDLFGGDERPLELEIGFGKGHFLLERAQNNGSCWFLGVETRRKWVDLVTERARKREIGNVQVRHGDIRRILPRISREGCVSRVFVNFPDPWWKARHEKRMVVTPELLVQVSRLLEDNGEIFVQTDVDFRLDTYAKAFSLVRDFLPLEGDGRVDQNPFGARSLREKKCQETGLPIYRLLFVRKPRQ